VISRLVWKFDKRFFILALLFLVTFNLISVSTVAFATDDATTTTQTDAIEIPADIGIGKIEIGKAIKVDGVTFPFTFIDGMLLNDGTRKIVVDGKTYNASVSTKPLDQRLNSSLESYTFVLDSMVTFYNPINRNMKSVGTGTEIKLPELPQIAILSDTFGNVSDVLCVPPSLEKVDILDSQTPINNISGKKFLLSSKSPYRIMGKVLLPSNNALILEDGVTVINALNSDLNVKGVFFSTGPVNIFGPGSITVSENGITYLEGNAAETDVNGSGGALVFLNDVIVDDVNVSQTNFVVIRNTRAKNVKVSSVYATYIIDSQIENLDIQNCRQVIINNVNAKKFNASIMSKVIAYSSELTEATASDFSEVNFVSSTISNLDVTRGTVAKIKDSHIPSISIEDYSILYTFKSSIEKLKSINSKYYTLSSQVSKIEK